MQRVVALLARGLSRSMRISGAEALSTVGDVFLGMTEAPLLIRPYIARMTESELFAVMCAGMATISGSVLLAYVAMGVDAGYLVTASFMSAPAAVMIAKVMVPETGVPETSSSAQVAVPRLDVNVIDAAARGASEGLQLALNVGAMLIAFVALVAMADKGASVVGGLFGHPELTLGRILGTPLAPLAYVMGVPWGEAPFVGELIGTKTVLNEFIAYQAMTSHLDLLSPKSVRIASFALCGFANFGSLAIVLGGIGGMAPERRGDLARLGVRSIVAGTLATCLSATIAGLVGG
jgi:CNT family concentrative nucleoside transporter